jgi:hypothetical protein
MLNRWLKEPFSDGPYVEYRGEKYHLRNPGLQSEVLVE